MKFKQILDQVDSDARDIKPHLFVLTIITAIVFAVGWLVGLVFRVVWLVIAWAVAAARVGFKAGRGKAAT